MTHKLSLEWVTSNAKLAKRKPRTSWAHSHSFTSFAKPAVSEANASKKETGRENWAMRRPSGEQN